MASGIGRPRASGASRSGLGTREDILSAAARLFSEVGFGGTSTHAIADAAGLRQASIYHHFASKYDILLALLLSTLQPSLDLAAALTPLPAPAPTRLWALCAADSGLLLEGEDNLGALYLLPEIYDPRLGAFHELRSELESAYTALIAECGVADPDESTWLVLALVESVIVRRKRAPGAVTAADAPAIASAVLRLLAVDADALAAAEADGPGLMADAVARC